MKQPVKKKLTKYNYAKAHVKIMMIVSPVAFTASLYLNAAERKRMKIAPSDVRSNYFLLIQQMMQNR